LQDMLLGMFGFFFCFFFFLLYLIIFAQHSIPRRVLHQYNISCIVVPQWQELY
jgi:quinol-cytochrome oxidoreductase complex cytochrome b subunit